MSKPSCALFISWNGSFHSLGILLRSFNTYLKNSLSSFFFVISLVSLLPCTLCTHITGSPLHIIILCSSSMSIFSLKTSKSERSISLASSSESILIIPCPENLLSGFAMIGNFNLSKSFASDTVLGTNSLSL